MYKGICENCGQTTDIDCDDICYICYIELQEIENQKLDDYFKEALELTRQAVE